MIMGVSLPLPLPALALVLLLVLLLLLLLIAGPYVPRSALGLARRVKGGEPQLTKRQIAIAQAAVAGVEQGLSHRAPRSKKKQKTKKKKCITQCEARG
jgi:hypothetical protein